MKQFKDFHDTWNWLLDHPYYTDHEHIEWGIGKGVEVCPESVFRRTLDIYVVKVNPISKRVSLNHTENTHTEIWLESGAWVKDLHMGWMASHDYELDCGGDTYEEAIMNLAQLVLTKYGDYENEDDN